MADRTIAFTGQVPLAGKDFLQPQRNMMASSAYLAEAVLGRATSVDGLFVVPTAPPTLAVRVDPGQIYSHVALDASAYGALTADTQHLVVKQGVQADPVTLAVTPPATSGFAQWYLVQVAFQERDVGATILPYYNAANPAEAYAGPNNSGEQQYTERRGLAVVQLKAGAPAPNGSHVRPSADPGWVGLAWVNAIQGLSSIQAQHIFPVPDVPRTRVKLPQIDRAIGFAYTVVTSNIVLTAEQSGLVVLDTGVIASNVSITLPPAGSIPGIPLRITIIARDLTVATRSGPRPVGLVYPRTGETLEGSPILLNGNDIIELMSNGASGWHWTGTKFQRGVIAATSATQTIPNGVETAVTFNSALDGAGWWNPANPSALISPAGANMRLRINAGCIFENNATGARRARVVKTGLLSGEGLPWVTQPATPSGDITALSLAGGIVALVGGDGVQLLVTQHSGGSLLLGSAWMSIEVLH